MRLRRLLNFCLDLIAKWIVIHHFRENADSMSSGPIERRAEPGVYSAADRPRHAPARRPYRWRDGPNMSDPRAIILLGEIAIRYPYTKGANFIIGFFSRGDRIASWTLDWLIIASPRTLESVVRKSVVDFCVCSLLPQASGLLYDLIAIKAGFGYKQQGFNLIPETVSRDE